MTDATPSSRLQTVRDMLPYRLNRLGAHAGAMVNRLCEGGHGITRREWGVVGLLREYGTLTPSALADRYELDRARTSRVVTSLVAKGLVLRDSPPGNRRQALLRLSPQGQALFERLMPQIQEINRGILGVLTESEMAQLDAFIVRLQASADRLRQSLDAELPRTQRRLGKRRADPAA
jgi:DNA-binding MarR family transcriptional regulator